MPAPRRYKPVHNISFGQVVEENRKQQDGKGRAKIDSAVHDWAFRQFLKKRGATITAEDRAIERQVIEIHRPLNRMGVEVITITPLGDLLEVRKDGGGEIGYKNSKAYYRVG